MPLPPACFVGGSSELQLASAQPPTINSTRNDMAPPATCTPPRVAGSIARRREPSTRPYARIFNPFSAVYGFPHCRGNGCRERGPPSITAASERTNCSTYAAAGLLGRADAPLAGARAWRRKGARRRSAELLPDAPVYTLVYDAAGMESSPLTRRAVHTSWLQNLPGATRHYPKYLPLMPRAARGLRLPDVDLVLCSDAAVAKAMTPHERSKVVCYCHSPPRYAFEPEISAEYARSLPAILRPLWGTVTKRVRAADYAAAQRVDQFIANSRHVAERIRRYYGRESVVIHPPVDLPGRACDWSARGLPAVRGLSHAVQAARPGRDDGGEAAAQARRHRRGAGGRAGLRGTTSASVEWLGWQSRAVIEDCHRRAAACSSPARRTLASCRSRRSRTGAQWSRTAWAVRRRA